MKKVYYNAYDERYKKVHEKKLSWTVDNNSEIIEKTINKYNISIDSIILEIGCGEGRDARYLLNKGYNVSATDVSEEAIRYCKEHDKEHSTNYSVLDVLDNSDNQEYDFIYSIACIHMLVLDEDRTKYYDFIYNHLKKDGLALILSMGDGQIESKSNISDAYNEVKRVHTETKEEMLLPATSCRIVNMDNFIKEAKSSNLKILESGVTSIIPEFNEIMYIVVKKESV